VNSGTPERIRVNSYSCMDILISTFSMRTLIDFSPNESRVIVRISWRGPYAKVASTLLVVRTPQDAPRMPARHGNGPTLGFGVLHGGLNVHATKSAQSRA